jgi:hypothetical protein
MRQIGLPITILRPMAFMELMTDKDFYPQVSVWHVMPKLMGWDRTLPWLAADDAGVTRRRRSAIPSDSWARTSHSPVTSGHSTSAGRSGPRRVARHEH